MDQLTKLKVRRNNLKQRYNITIEDYNRVFEVQGGRCAICKKHQSILPRTLAIDHNHQTGEIRSLLCCPCNAKLTEHLEWWIIRAAAYLQYHQKKV